MFRTEYVNMTIVDRLILSLKLVKNDRDDKGDLE